MKVSAAAMNQALVQATPLKKKTINRMPQDCQRAPREQWMEKRYEELMEACSDKPFEVVETDGDYLLVHNGNRNSNKSTRT